MPPGPPPPPSPRPPPPLLTYSTAAHRCAAILMSQMNKMSRAPDACPLLCAQCCCCCCGCCCGCCCCCCCGPAQPALAWPVGLAARISPCFMDGGVLRPGVPGEPGACWRLLEAAGACWSSHGVSNVTDEDCPIRTFASKSQFEPRARVG